MPANKTGFRSAAGGTRQARVLASVQGHGAPRVAITPRPLLIAPYQPLLPVDHGFSSNSPRVAA